jgi:NADH:ubiquinone oxidoreductase subunit C
MTDISFVVARMKAIFMHRIQDVRTMPVAEHVVRIGASDLREVVIWLLAHSDCQHLSTITAVDNGQQIELFYHFWDRQGLSLHINLPRQEPRIDSLTDLIPGAMFYEREVLEMFGVKFSGLQQNQPLLLPDDWDGQSFPMRLEPDEEGNKEGS